MKCALVLALGLLISGVASARSYKCSFLAGSGARSIFIPDTILQLTTGTSKPDAKFATAIPHSSKSIMVNFFTTLNNEAIGITFAEHNPETGEVDPLKIDRASVLLAQKKLLRSFTIGGQWDEKSYYTLDCNKK